MVSLIYLCQLFVPGVALSLCTISLQPAAGSAGVLQCSVEGVTGIPDKSPATGLYCGVSCYWIILWRSGESSNMLQGSFYMQCLNHFKTRRGSPVADRPPPTNFTTLSNINKLLIKLFPPKILNINFFIYT